MQNSNILFTSVSEINSLLAYAQNARDSIQNTVVLPPDHPGSAPVLFLDDRETSEIEVISAHGECSGKNNLLV